MPLSDLEKRGDFLKYKARPNLTSRRVRLVSAESGFFWHNSFFKQISLLYIHRLSQLELAKQFNEKKVLKNYADPTCAVGSA